MHAEYLALDYCGYWQEIKCVIKVVPYVVVTVFFVDLFVKTVHICDVP